MPRILCFLHSFEPGGVERTALRLCGAWHESGADVAIILGRDEGPLRSEAPNCTILVPPEPSFSTAPVETAWMIAMLPGFIRRWRPDVIYCAGNSYTVVAVAMKLLLGRRCPPIVAKISNDLERPDMPAPVRPFYRAWCAIQAYFLDHIVALSPAMRDEICRVMRVTDTKVSVIGNPVLDLTRHADLAEAGALARRTRGNGRRFLAVGRLVPQKDFDLLIRAFARGADPADRLVIAGEGPERRRLERLIDCQMLGDRVKLAGHSVDVGRWIAKSDLLILSSRYEGLPGVVIEALAAGLGIIATDCCTSIAGLLDHGRFGTLVPPRSLPALAAAIADARRGQSDVAAAAALAASFDAHLAAKAYRRLIDQMVPPPVLDQPLRAPDHRTGWTTGSPYPCTNLLS